MLYILFGKCPVRNLVETQTNLAELSHIFSQVFHRSACKISNSGHDHSYSQLSISQLQTIPQPCYTIWEIARQKKPHTKQFLGYARTTLLLLHWYYHYWWVPAP